MRKALMGLALALTTACATSGANTTATTTPQDTAAADTASAPTKKLYERLGGQPAVEAVIDDFLGRVAGDERINAGFAVGHVPRLRQRLVELVCAATGGPCTYSGRSMEVAHAGMKITNAQFDALVGHLVATLDKFKVPTTEKGELLALLGPMRSSIVEED